MILYFLYLILSPIIWFSASIIALIPKKSRERLLSERAIRRDGYRKLNRERGSRDVIIFHGASGGEFEQLKPLLPLINRDKYYIFQTVYSATVYRKEYNSTLFDTIIYHPLDSIISAFIFFKRVKPTIYMVNRHDLWPSHLFVAKLLGIKTVLINGNVHDGSHRNSIFLKLFNRFLFNSFDCISCGSNRLKNSISKFAPNSQIDVIGDSRFDQVAFRAKNNRYNHLTNYDKYDTVVLGSIIGSDYIKIFPAIKRFSDENSNFRVIAVPHEVDEMSLERLEITLNENGLTFDRLSNNKSLNGNVVKIADSVGILAELYGYGKYAYVGAGFGAGVHSVIEPAIYNIPVSYGPNISLLDEAVEMVDLNIATIINSSEDFYQFLNMSEERAYEIEELSNRFFTNRSSVCKKIVELYF